MADAGLLEASPADGEDTGEDTVQPASGGSSDEETYERMTAAEVFEKLEEVSS